MGNPDPAVCAGGLMTEGYNYTSSGLVATKRLTVERVVSPGQTSAGMLTAYWIYDNEGRLSLAIISLRGTSFTSAA